MREKENECLRLGKIYHFIILGLNMIHCLQERVALTCIENRIAVYSPHTVFDSLAGGVTDWMLQPFRKYDSSVINALS